MSLSWFLQRCDGTKQTKQNERNGKLSPRSCPAKLGQLKKLLRVILQLYKSMSHNLDILK